MSSPYPILTNGLATSQGIYDVETSEVVPVGTRAALGDGRVYYYARSSSSAILAAGAMNRMPAVSVDHDIIAITTQVVGDTTIGVTPVGTAVYTANSLAGGFITIHTGTTGAGIAYKIKSNPLTVAATEYTVTLYDPIAVAIHADCTATVTQNPWMDVLISATGVAQTFAGVSNIAVPAGDTTAQYFWCQTWGVCAVKHDLATATGGVVSGGATVAGEVQVSATDGSQALGVNLFTAAASAFNPTFLTIAP